MNRLEWYRLIEIAWGNDFAQQNGRVIPILHHPVFEIRSFVLSHICHFHPPCTQLSTLYSPSQLSPSVNLHPLSSPPTPHNVSPPLKQEGLLRNSKSIVFPLNSLSFSLSHSSLSFFPSSKAKIPPKRKFSNSKKMPHLFSSHISRDKESELGHYFSPFNVHSQHNIVSRASIFSVLTAAE